MLLTDRVAIVTGGAKGMGRSTSLKFAAGGKAIATKTDVTKKVEIMEMVEKTICEFGRIDSLINTAGGVPGTEGRGDSETIVEEEWDRIINLNLKGTGCINSSLSFVQGSY